MRPTSAAMSSKAMCYKAMMEFTGSICPVMVAMNFTAVTIGFYDAMGSTAATMYNVYSNELYGCSYMLNGKAKRFYSYFCRFFQLRALTLKL